MELILATKDFKIKGVSYPEFPLIVDKEMRLVKEVFDSRLRQCITHGRVQSVNSWAAYGQCTYDFFGFLERSANWDCRYITVNRDSTILSSYRDWSLGKFCLSPNTVNYRLRIIISFNRSQIKSTTHYSLINIVGPTRRASLIRYSRAWNFRSKLIHTNFNSYINI